MRKFLLTSAVALPFTMAAAFAQDAVPAEDPAMQPEVTEPMTTDPAADPAADPMADPAADPMADPAADPMADPAADPMAAEPMDAAPMETDPMADPMAADDMAVEETDADEMAAQAAAAEKVVQQQDANELRIDWITGTTVEAPDGTNIGSISDLIVDGETGELKAAVVGVGGFLGIGQKNIALPWEQLSINFDAREITSDLTREEADAAPEYVFRDRTDAPAPAADGMGADPAMAPAADPMADPAMPPAN